MKRIASIAFLFALIVMFPGCSSLGGLFGTQGESGPDPQLVEQYTQAKANLEELKANATADITKAVAEGDAYFSQKLEYSQSRAVGAELGMLAASGEAMTQKKELVRRFLWAYLKAEETLSKNKDVFDDAYSKYTGLPLNVTKESAKIIKLGGVLTKDQVSRLAEAAFKQGIVQKDVTKEAAALYDDSMVVELKK
jgi:hypothetical protein